MAILRRTLLSTDAAVGLDEHRVAVADQVTVTASSRALLTSQAIQQPTPARPLGHVAPRPADNQRT